MKRYGLDRVITFFIGGLIFSLFLAGCSSALKYPGTAGVDTGKMTPYQKGSINVLIPPDYIEDVLLESNKQEGMMFKVLGANAKQAVFRKKDSSGIITVLCWDGLSFVPNNQLNEIARSGVTKNLSEGKLAAGTYEFGSGFFKTYFEKYSGNDVKKGQNISMTIWTAWRGTAGFDCKYVIYGVTSAGASDFENDFVSVVRNIK